MANDPDITIVLNGPVMIGGEVRLINRVHYTGCRIRPEECAQRNHIGIVEIGISSLRHQITAAVSDVGHLHERTSGKCLRNREIIIFCCWDMAITRSKRLDATAGTASQVTGCGWVVLSDLGQRGHSSIRGNGSVYYAERNFGG